MESKGIGLSVISTYLTAEERYQCLHGAEEGLPMYVQTEDAGRFAPRYKSAGGE